MDIEMELVRIVNVGGNKWELGAGSQESEGNKKIRRFF
jgi:hypothetical protein